jgi:hypothetical protein
MSVRVPEFWTLTRLIALISIAQRITDYFRAGALVSRVLEDRHFAVTFVVVSVPGTLLTGTLSNITLDQHGKIVVLAGTLNGEQVSMIIDLPFGRPLSKLKGPHSTELGAFSVGEAFDTVTPEPGTILLFGSGLLLVAGVLRRRLIAS